MSPIVLAVGLVTVIGLICAVGLSIASKVMAVPVDERFGPVRECLPGANCGACGYAGCDAYAQALISGEGVKTNLCVPGGAAAAQGISAALGVAAEEVIPMMAYVRCNGTCENTSVKQEYKSAKGCAAAKLFYGGDGACTYGCLGFGDCAAVCPKEAIDLVNGVAKVDPDLCIGCAMCSKVCPNHIIDMIPAASKVVVTCSSKAKGPVAMKACKASCIGCKKCEKTCPNGAITVTDNLAYIDQSKCTACGLCAEACPKKCITVR
ncbi:RnfABCDGE type electron transport complex subunit B [Yanshouia hominis]|uniref:Ion-translocating oxidoreductase complex subunit B n=1 Tax=Yanshouia hominis TaxID=2763673 RepID=A0ABR7NKY1_9FIRM|nr:RnfABCDGE type electron transport complex subunit B [Yanshouia hominis]MBC8577057.1 RnfABCDGE type electron transport complex subunit B [Yanshouia hominis]